MDLKLFVGTAKESKIKGVYSMNLWCAGKFLSLPVRAYTYEQGITHHRLVLFAIYDFLRINDKKHINLTVYTENESAVFEWENEYKKDGSFCTSTADRDLWEAIAASAKRNHISLTIKGQSNAQTGISKIEKDRIG